MLGATGANMIVWVKVCAAILEEDSLELGAKIEEYWADLELA